MTSADRGREGTAWPALAYALFVVYGSLYPFSGWRTPATVDILASHSGHVSRADVVTNLVLYVPLGLLLSIPLGRRLRPVLSCVVVGALGTLLSIGLEVAQAWLPARNSSIRDLILNAIGAILGVLGAGLLRRNLAPGRFLAGMRRDWLRPGRLADFGLGVLGLWGAAQLSPFMPSITMGRLRQGLRPLWQVLRGEQAFDALHAGTYALSLLGLGGMASTLLLPGRDVVVTFGIFSGAVFLLKVFVTTRQLSAEALCGFAVALAALSLVRRLGRAPVLVISGGSMLAAFVAQQFRRGVDASLVTRSLNWMPLGTYRLNIMDVAEIAASMWPFLGLAYLVRCAAGRPVPRAAAWLGGVAVFLVALSLEWSQQAIPGRTPDATGALFPVLGWCIPFFFEGESSRRVRG